MPKQLRRKSRRKTRQWLFTNGCKFRHCQASRTACDDRELDRLVLRSNESLWHGCRLHRDLRLPKGVALIGLDACLSVNSRFLFRQRLERIGEETVRRAPTA